MSHSDKPFTVSDRRHFTPEGRPRDEPAALGDVATAPDSAASRPGPDDAPADFSHFLLGLAAEAGRLIAGEGLPEDASTDDVLRGARSIIAILEMLKDKSEGRRTPAEDALVAQLLFELRMAYVERTRAGQP
jgi:hypothetical protein